MLLTAFLSIAIFQGIVLGVLILRSPLFKSKANKYLAYAIFSLSILLLSQVFELTQAYDSFPYLRFIDDFGLEFLFPVFIYFFIAYQADRPIIYSRKTFWLFVPFLLHVITYISSDLSTISHLYHIPDSVEVVILSFKILGALIALVFMPGVLIYAYPLIKLLKKVEEKRWLTQLWLISFILLASFSLTIILTFLINFDILPAMNILALFATFLIHWTAYSGIFKFKLAREQEEIRVLLKRLKPNEDFSTDRGMPSTIMSNSKKAETFTKENSYFKKLEDLCMNEHIYKDSTLDRDKVAEMLGISKGYVSQLVNAVTGSNFATYINQYRVEAVKEIILNSEFDNYSLLAIGLECGFSSKSTFHNSFKKITGITPSDYRKRYK